MNEVATAFSGILTAITPVVEKFASIFNTSVDAIQANLMTYVMMYGKYCATKSAIGGAIFGFILSIIISCIFVNFNSSMICDEIADTRMKLRQNGVGYKDADSFVDEASSKYDANVFKFVILTIILTTLFFASIAPLLYYLNPEIYSIEKTFNLINTIK